MSAAAELHQRLRRCDLCPRRCGVNRLEDELGYCGVGAHPVVSSWGPHFGEERVLVGNGGSGTIFFTGCNLGCVFCQNYEISHFREGRRVTTEDLVETMLSLERAGCWNVNWVTPTHQAAAILAALETARWNGLHAPTVFNCGGYERAEILRLMEGAVDIYMPDAKYWSSESAKRYSAAPDYPERMREALREMHRQVGDLEVRDGRAVRGLLVRHLAMPGGAEESLAILDFLAKEISSNTFVNVMDQYRPTFRAHEFPQIDRPVSDDEYARVAQRAGELGLRVSD